MAPSPKIIRDNDRWWEHRRWLIDLLLVRTHALSPTSLLQADISEELCLLVFNYTDYVGALIAARIVNLALLLNLNRILLTDLQLGR